MVVGGGTIEAASGYLFFLQNMFSIVVLAYPPLYACKVDSKKRVVYSECCSAPVSAAASATVVVCVWNMLESFHSACGLFFFNVCHHTEGEKRRARIGLVDGG